MRNMKKVLAVSVICAMLLGLNIQMAAASETYEYNVGASVTTGQSYRWVVPMCELVNKYSDIVTLNPIPTSGSTENVNMILSGDCAFGVGPVSTVYNAINGKEDWEGNPATGIEFTYAYMGDYFNIYLYPPHAPS